MKFKLSVIWVLAAVFLSGCAGLAVVEKTTPVVTETKGQEIVSDYQRPVPDISLVVNEEVRAEIETLKKSPHSVDRWLITARRFAPMMKGVLRAQGVPGELVYVAIIESGFSPEVTSSMGAGGPWQFMPTTAKGFGMDMNEWVDERRDFEKSTIAAAKYFSSLYAAFSNWELALAGYNCGSGSVRAAIKECGSVCLWDMAKMGRLKFQAEGYVPRVIALMVIMEDPKAYGFQEPTNVVPFTYDKVYVPGGLPLWLFAKMLNVKESTLASLNPELIKKVTPPDAKDYELKIPAGKKRLFLEKFSEACKNYRHDLIIQGQIKKNIVK